LPSGGSISVCACLALGVGRRRVCAGLFLALCLGVTAQPVLAQSDLDERELANMERAEMEFAQKVPFKAETAATENAGTRLAERSVAADAAEPRRAGVAERPAPEPTFRRSRSGPTSSAVDISRDENPVRRELDSLRDRAPDRAFSARRKDDETRVERDPEPSRSGHGAQGKTRHVRRESTRSERKGNERLAPRDASLVRIQRRQSRPMRTLCSRDFGRSAAQEACLWRKTTTRSSTAFASSVPDARGGAARPARVRARRPGPGARAFCILTKRRCWSGCASVGAIGIGQRGLFYGLCAVPLRELRTV
jgi:hypothetical protein